MIGISVAANKERNCVREYFKDMMIPENDNSGQSGTINKELA